MAIDTGTVGFIGLGLMGAAFTQRLAERGHQVVGYDIDAAKVKAAEEWGVRPAANPAEVAGAADVVLVCVISTKAVGEVVFGEDGIAGAASAGKVLVDHSTTEVGATREWAARLKAETGMDWVDAPVSGGPPAARAGTLAVMAGGEAAAVEAIVPVMADVAGGFTHMGPVGAGQVTKMVNQVLVLNNYAILAEALRLAEKGGVDPAKIPDALAAGHAGSNMLRNLFPRFVARDFAPAGYARQVMKDLDMVHDLARDLKTPVPMSEQALSLFRLLNSRGHGELDGVAVLKLYDEGPV